MNWNVMKAIVAGAALCVPCACLAAESGLPAVTVRALPLGPEKAVDNCALAQAARMDVRLLGAQYSPVTPKPRWELGASRMNMLVTARNPQGKVVSQMVCTYNREDQVVALHRATPSEVNQWLWG